MDLDMFGSVKKDNLPKTRIRFVGFSFEVMG